MMAPPSDSTQDLVERFQQLAATQTAASRPWPGLDRALRRSRRRRRAGVSGLAAAVLLITGAASTGLLEAPTLHVSPASKARQAELSQLREQGYGRPVIGSLAGDDGWLTQLRQHVAKEIGKRSGSRIQADDVLVLWADDVARGRYAFVRYVIEASRGGGPSTGAALLAGPAGAEANQLAIRKATFPSTPNPVTAAQVVITDAENPTDAVSGVAVVIGPEVEIVQVATGRRFTDDGNVKTSVRELPRAGHSAWVGTLTAAERYLSDLRIGGSPIDETFADKPLPAVDRFTALAPAGTNGDVLGRASDLLPHLGATALERPVLATARALERNHQLGATVLRSPDGPHLVAFSVARMQPNGDRVAESVAMGAVIGSTAEPEALFTVVHSDLSLVEKLLPFALPAHLVLAPERATQVRMGSDVAQVQNRLATFPFDTLGAITAEALDSNGTVIATTRPVPAAK